MKEKQKFDADATELRILGYEGVIRSPGELSDAIERHNWLFDSEGSRTTKDLLSSYDQGKAKPLSQLFEEALKGESVLGLEEVDINGKSKTILSRYIHVAALRVYYINQEEERLELVERHQEIYRPYKQKDWEVGKITPTINKRSLHTKQIPEAKLSGVPPLEKVLANEKSIGSEENILIDIEKVMARTFVEEVLPTLDIGSGKVIFVEGDKGLMCTWRLGGEDISFRINGNIRVTYIIAAMRSAGIERQNNFDILKYMTALDKGVEFDNVKSADILRLVVASLKGGSVSDVKDIDIAKYFIEGGDQAIKQMAASSLRFPNDNWTKMYPGVLSHYIFDVIDFSIKKKFVKDSHHLTEYKGDGRVVIRIFDWKKV